MVDDSCLSGGIPGEAGWEDTEALFQVQHFSLTAPTENINSMQLAFDAMRPLEAEVGVAGTRGVARLYHTRLAVNWWGGDIPANDI